MVKKSEIKTGGIIVRTDKNWDQKKSLIGRMYKITSNHNESSMSLWGGWSISRNNARLADSEEIAAYNNGIRNIKDIVKKHVDNYSII